MSVDGKRSPIECGGSHTRHTGRGPSDATNVQRTPPARAPPPEICGVANVTTLNRVTYAGALEIKWFEEDAPMQGFKEDCSGSWLLEEANSGKASP